MSAIGLVHCIVFDCPDPVRLAEFYRDLTGWPIAHGSADWQTVRADDTGIGLSFQLAPDHQAPAWPDPASPMQAHLDFTVDDLDTAEEQALRLGATKFAHQPNPSSFRVYADPAGHPFCLCV